MAHAHKSFIPAAGYDFLLPLYDPFTRLLGVESARRQLIEQASLRPGQRALEIGCGTGSLTVQLKRLHPGVEVVGLDPDLKAMARAQRKAERAGVRIGYEHGYADNLPFEAGSFDAVFSSLMLHHLTAEQQGAALREVKRVLEPGGTFHLLDFAAAERPRGFLARLLHSAEHLPPASRVLELIRSVGFKDAAETGGRSTILGPIAYHRGTA